MSNRSAFILCTALTIAFAAGSYLAVLRNAPTIDEPICALSGYFDVVEGDLRFDVDNPPLWKYWAALPNLGRELRLERAGEGAPKHENGFHFATRVLFQTPGNDGIGFVNRSRAMLLVPGLILVVISTIWAWQVAGAPAAATVCALLSLDPNLLAHTPLVKADVSIALLMTGIAWTTWLIGRTARPVAVVALGALWGAAASIKYNGIPLALISMLLLLLRSARSEPWTVAGHQLLTGARRAAAAIAIGILAAGIAWSVIWAVYQFRFEPTRTGELLDVGEQARQLTEAQLHMRNGVPPTPQQVDAAPTPLVARLAMFLDRHRLFPQAWLYGLVSVYRSSTTVLRPSYLFGEVSSTGWWYYFPLTFLFKAPLATVAALGLVVLALPMLIRLRLAPRVDRWTVMCVAIPMLVYGVASTMSNTDSGVRYILPLMPLLFICMGVAVAKLLGVYPRLAPGTLIALGLCLAIETAGAFPHYISFFNAAARPYRLFLLSDSNFDWGQDLLYVAQWRRENPTVPLYLAYWGPVDPAYLGIDNTVLPGGFAMGSDRNDPFPPRRRSVLLIGATLLQGANSTPQIREFYRPLMDLPPRGMVGDTFYLHELSGAHLSTPRE